MRRATCAAATLAATAVLAGCGGEDAATPAPASGATSLATYADPGGDGRLVVARGEALRPRTELLGSSAVPRPGRVLARIGQLTDTHVRDEESPGRPVFLDRLGAPFTATFRPQEALTTQVLAAGVRAVDAQRPDLTLITGDVIDNDQSNELRQALATLKGGRVDPDSGARGYGGIQDAGDADPSFYRPDVDPPRHPGILDAAQRPFESPGLRGRVALVPGNHDLLVAGEVAPTRATQRIATGDERLVQPDPDLRVPRVETQAASAVKRLLPDGRLPGTTTRVPADPDRRELGAPEYLSRVRAAGLAAPGGHAADRLDGVVDLGSRVRVVVLDVTKRAGLDRGFVRSDQLRFLRRALDTDRWVVVASHQPLRKVAGGDQALALIGAHRNVVATVAGDTHHDRIAPVGRHWDITSSALADWPQQARSMVLRETAGGGVVLETQKLDTVPGGLADTARELAYLDAQGGRPGANAGGRLDRNVALYVPPR